MSIRRPDENRINAVFAFLRIRDSISRRLIGKVKVMSNKLRSFLIVVISIAVVMAALPVNAFRVNAGGFSVCYWLDDDASSCVEVLDSETVLSPNDEKLNFKKDGYKFTGWTDFAGHPYSVGDPVDKELELKGTWTEDTDNYVNVTFMPNNGEIDGDPVTIQVAKTGTGIAVPTEWTVPAGYRLDKWTTDANGSVESYNTTDSYTLSGDTTLYGQWKEFYTITFNANDGTNRTSQETQDKDPSGTTKYQLRPDVFPYDGYIVDNWAHSSGGSSSGVSYGASDLITLTENLSLNAYWVREITFHAHNGIEPEETPTTQRIPIKDKQPLDANGFTAPAGKTFVGWSTQPDDTTIKYVDGASVEITGDNTKDIEHDLYAQWGSICTITFDANDSAYYGTADGSMSDAKVGIGFTTVLPACVFTRAGHTFAGWEDPSVTGVKINADNSITIDSTYSGEPITLKANWTPSTHAVTFKDDDGSVIASTTYNYGVVPTPAVPTKAPTKESVYTFDGWKDTSTENTVYKDSLPAVTGAATYQATYTASPRPYTVSVSVTDTAGGSVEASSTKNYGEEATITVELQNGYHIESWTITSGDSVLTEKTENVSYTFTVIGDTEVTVEIAKNPYIVTVTSSEGGTASAPTGLVYNDEAQLSATASEGYRFVNWTDSAGQEVSTDPNYKFTVVTDVTLNANFTLLNYDINLSSGGHGTVSGDGNFKHFESVTVTATPENGYHFVNWTEDGTEVIASPEYTFMVTGARNLTANFAINSYAIDISAGKNGSVSGSETGTYNHFSSVTVTATPDKGYHFVNWTENGTEVSTDPEYTFTVTGARNLKANFAINMYTVTYKNDDGTILQEGEMPWGSTASYQHMANPTKKPTAQFTYTFAGWDNKETLVTKDITYTATYTYTVNKYKITFANEDGTVLQTGEIEYGKFPVYEKDTPTKAATVQETFTFAGWDKEISKVTGETVYTATYTSKPITKDSINYKYFTVAFVTNGGSEIVSQLVAEGGVAFRPEEPLRERYTFGGWYIDEALTKPFSFATAITSDITLYAKWIKGSPDIEATYAVVGLGSTAFELGSGEDITVAVERSKDNDSIATHFKGVLIDGVEVAYYNYELAEDNSSVIIRADALEGLDAGTHTVTIVYDDGTAEVELVVADANEPTAAVEKITETEAGDTEPVNVTAEKTSNWGLWIALGIVAVVVIAAIPIFIIKGRSLK